jgi:hypothetical protein
MEAADAIPIMARTESRGSVDEWFWVFSSSSSKLGMEPD